MTPSAFGSSVSDGRPPGGADPRVARLAALVLILGVAQFFVFHLVVQFAWPEPYSWARNNISDLGVVGCGPWPGDGRYVCSPLHSWMNASFMLQGVFFVAGLVLVASHRRGFLTRTSLVCFSLAGLGWVLAGLAPADVNEDLHVLGAFLIFFCGNAGLVFAENPARTDGAQYARAYPPALGTIGLVATALFLGQVYLVFGMGGMERLAVFPLQIWAVLAGIHVLRTLLKKTPADQNRDPGGKRPASQEDTRGHETERSES